MTSTSPVEPTAGYSRVESAVQDTVNNLQEVIHAVSALPPEAVPALLAAVASLAAAAAGRQTPRTTPTPSTTTETPPAISKLALNRNKAAEALSMSVRTLDDLRKRGLIRPSLATGRPLYPAKELQRYLDSTR